MSGKEWLGEDPDEVQSVPCHTQCCLTEYDKLEIYRYMNMTLHTAGTMYLHNVNKMILFVSRTMNSGFHGHWGIEATTGMLRPPNL